MAARRSKGVPWGELLWAAFALLLLSPLLVFAKSGMMPIWGLFAVATGIAISLALAGRRLHDAFLADVVRQRQSVGRWLIAVAVMMVGMFVVLVGVAVALIWIARKGLPTSSF